MRKHYIDNLRVLIIALLFPFHTCRIFTTENFYVHGEIMNWCDELVWFLSSWFMGFLFLLAGMSTYFSLEKRSNKAYLKERFTKLFVPFLFGVVLMVPIQTYYAERYHNQYTGSYFAQLKLFFTKIGDLSGYTGGLTPAHYWFLLLLFMISVIGLPIVIQMKKMPVSKKSYIEHPVGVILLFLAIMIASVFEVLGEQIGKYFILFIIGSKMAKQDRVFEILEQYRRGYLGIAVLCFVYLELTRLAIVVNGIQILIDLIRYLGIWSIMLALLGYGKKYLNQDNRITKYLVSACFPIYEVHQTLLIVVGYYTLGAVSDSGLQYIIIMLSTLVLSIIAYESIKRFKWTRFIFGMKNKPMREI